MQLCDKSWRGTREERAKFRSCFLGVPTTSSSPPRIEPRYQQSTLCCAYIVGPFHTFHATGPPASQILSVQDACPVYRDLWDLLPVKAAGLPAQTTRRQPAPCMKRASLRLSFHLTSRASRAIFRPMLRLQFANADLIRGISSSPWGIFPGRFDSGSGDEETGCPAPWVAPWAGSGCSIVRIQNGVGDTSHQGTI